jgi:large subunit ribosomal protein L25
VSFEIQGQARAESGRTISRRLRRVGRVPAIIYGGGKDPSAITLDHNSLLHQMEAEAFFTSILTLKVGSESHSVVVKEVQRHPAKPELMHLDFQRVLEDEEITITVPIHFIGEQLAKGVKDQGGAIEHTLTDVEISCLPRDLPEFLELDVTALGLNETLHLSDIKLPAGVTSIALSHGHDHPVVGIHPPRREEVDVAAEAEEAVTEGEEAAAAAAAAPAADSAEAPES